MIELPDFITESLVERTYRRMIELGEKGENNQAARALLVRGMNAARARSPRMLLFLDKGAEILRRKNDEQVSRFAQEGYCKTDYNEFAQWRSAFLLAVEPNETVKYRVFGWVYAAAAEAVL